MNGQDSLDELRTRFQQQVDGQALLLEITQRIAVGGSLAAVLPDITNAALRGSGAAGIRIILAGTTYASGALAEKMIKFDALIDQIIRTSGPLEVPDLTTASAEPYAPLREALGAVIALPMMAGKTSYGVLWVGYEKPNQFSAGEQMFLSIVAGQTAVAIANTYAFNAARQGREQLAAILSSSVDPVLVVSDSETVVLLNPAAELAFGVKADVATGQLLDQVINAPPLVELLRDANAPATETIEWQAESGQTFAPRVSDMHNDDGTRVGRVLILRDITRYKNLRENQSIFVHTVAHDLRSPLTYMHGYATMMPMVGAMNDKQKGFADKIISGIAQMTDLVDKILDAGRLDPEGYYDLNREPCDVNQMVTDIVGNHTQAAEKKNLTVAIEADPALPILNLDDMMLRRALNNLVDNAIKYTPDNGKVTVSAFVKDRALLLSVKDTGLGISEENQKHLFERFKRVRRKEHNGVKGSGLGLFIVKSLAQKHGGDAWVESAEGQGSTFSISIPLEGANLIVSEKNT